jgi:hypothetical protein
LSKILQHLRWLLDLCDRSKDNATAVVAWNVLPIVYNDDLGIERWRLQGLLSYGLWYVGFVGMDCDAGLRIRLLLLLYWLELVGRVALLCNMRLVSQRSVIGQHSVRPLLVDPTTTVVEGAGPVLVQRLDRSIVLTCQGR